MPSTEYILVRFFDTSFLYFFYNLLCLTNWFLNTDGKMCL